MTIEESLGIDEFDPSAVRIGLTDISSLDEMQMNMLAQYCDTQIARWEDIKQRIKDSWQEQEAVRRTLSMDLSDDPASYMVQSMIGGSVSQFACAFDLAVKRISELKRLREATEADVPPTDD